jgi:PIN domain nuclease of toxin-antitoxin system
MAELLSRADTEPSISPASAWEIAIKHGRGRLPLPVPLDRFLPTVRERYSLASLPIDEESALHIVKLPALHADPFDRMLVSQAIVHGLTIVTPDPLVTQYPARTIW